MPTLQLNGKTCTINADGATTLLCVLRDELGLSGPKFGCGQGECGSCMVLVDGKPQTSCNLPLWAAEGHDIVTVEGLGTPEQPHRLQTAFCETRAAQCGYCLAGILISSAALLAKNPSRTVMRSLMRSISTYAAAAHTTESSRPFSAQPRPNRSTRLQPRELATAPTQCLFQTWRPEPMVLRL